MLSKTTLHLLVFFVCFGSLFAQNDPDRVGGTVEIGKVIPFSITTATSKMASTMTNSITAKTQNTNLEWPNPGAVHIEKTAEATSDLDKWKINILVQGKNIPKTTDVVLIIDNSGSMSGTKIESTKNAAKTFVTQLLNNSSEIRVAIVTINSKLTAGSPDLIQNFTTNSNSLHSAIDGILARGGTNLQGGFHAARILLQSSNATNKTAILLSDGDPTYSYASTVKTDFDLNCGNKSGFNILKSDFENIHLQITQSDYSQVVGNANDYNHTLFSKTLNCNGNKTFVAGNHGIPTQYEANLLQNEGVGVYTIGFQVAAGENAEKILKGSQNKGYFPATETNIESVYSQIRSNIAYAATNAVFTDPMSTYIVLESGSTPSYSVLPDTSGNVVISKGSVTFTPNGFVLNDPKDPTSGNSNLVKWKITWHIGTVSELGDKMYYPVTMSPNVNPTVLYDANEQTYMDYTDVNGNTHARQQTPDDFTIPKVSGGKGSIEIIYYTVNQNGEPINSAGTVVSQENAVKLIPGNSFYFTYTNSTALNINQTYQVIPDPTYSYNNKNYQLYWDLGNLNIMPTATEPNKKVWFGYRADAKPTACNMEYCLNEVASPLSASLSNVSNNSKLFYFDSLNGVPQTSITPQTNEVGEKTYYVAEGPSSAFLGSKVPIKVLVNSAPTIELIKKNDLLCHSSNTGNIDIEVCSGTAPYTYSWTKDNLPFNASAQDISNLAAGNYEVRVTDSKGCCSTKSFMICQPSEPLTTTFTQQNVSCFNGSDGSATVAPKGGTGHYTYNWFPSGGSACTASNLKSGTYTVTITDENACNIKQEIIILDGDNTKPVISPLPAPITISCKDVPHFTTATATDEKGTIVSLNYVEKTIPANCANSYSITRTWTAIDNCGNESLPVCQTIHVEDTTAPIWSTTLHSLDKTIKCCDTNALTEAQDVAPKAVDDCSENAITIQKTCGKFITATNCANSGTITNTWIAIDACGKTSEVFTQIITIEDTTAPKFDTDSLPTDIIVSCDAIPSPANVLAKDDCNTNVTVDFKEMKTLVDNSCSSNYTLTRTWKASDCSGNTSCFTQTILVKDTTAPTGTAPESIANLTSINQIPTPCVHAITDATDNCDGNVNIEIADQNNGGSGCLGNPYILTRTYTLSDCSGNKTELKQTFTVENKLFVQGIASPVSCFNGNDGAIAISKSENTTVAITNEKGDRVSNTNLPAGTYTLTATSSVGNTNKTCSVSETVVITQPLSKVGIAGKVINITTNLPLANVPVTLIPQGNTQGNILLKITDQNGNYQFTNVLPGDYLVQVQDANLNNAQGLYPANSSLYFTKLEECAFQIHDFEYEKSALPVLGDFVWYDVNNNGIQDEWYDANNDGKVTQNIPDENGYIDYSNWEWIDYNGDGSYAGAQNIGELNAAGFGNAKSVNIIITGPNNYYDEVIVGIQGFWRNRPEQSNPYGAYKIELKQDANLNSVSEALGATGLVKVLPTAKRSTKSISGKSAKISYHTECNSTNTSFYNVVISAQDLVHLDNDFGISCKTVTDVIAIDDNAGTWVGINKITPNVINVLTNDKWNDVPATLSNITLTTLTPNPFLQLNPDGSIAILANAPKGIQTLVYQICDLNDNSICATATVTVTIEAPKMDVIANGICVNDVPYLEYTVTPTNFTSTEGVTITWKDASNKTISTMTNLSLSGRILWPGAVVDSTGKGMDWPGWVKQDDQWVQTADGFEGLRPTATLVFSVNPEQTVVVNYPPSDPMCTARPTFAIDAVNDKPSPVSSLLGGTNISNIFNNDTLNGQLVLSTTVDLTVLSAPINGIKVNPNGTVDVAPETPPGIYIITYQICEKSDNGNCDQATVTITVIDNQTQTISLKACNDDSTVLDLLTLLPNNTPTNGTWRDKSTSNSLEGSLFSSLGLSVRTYVFEYTISNENYNQIYIINMEINDDCKVLPAPPICADLVPHNAISPNGDHKNDLFIIDNIDEIGCYPENNVQIFNRWGILVFETTNYNNTTNYFDGKSRGRSTINKSDDLPTGTYFYLIQYSTTDSDGKLIPKKQDGFLYLSK
ncbi:T9SS type B sorting domain-containing protein [Flavobacterium agrisoli]|uniref:Gliding motility-associated C-terminal domain-containing protein n=1 Tax=Flavobacterium agrisoli TaxID=2793066 RepID=A0A934PKZ8_9FLAO|nr:gliding motility-associated C-terminal domain-containing protein [Flavobacterium agrisoli]MBK0370107.1 gliding motility-associated C-terminal domain-containing protein [Flavobacterium agrisoli]